VNTEQSIKKFVNNILISNSFYEERLVAFDNCFSFIKPLRHSRQVNWPS